MDAVRQILSQNLDLNLNTAIDGRKILADAIEAKNSGILAAILETKRVDLNGWVVSFQHPLERPQDCFSFKCLKSLRNRSKDHSISPVFMAIELGHTEKLQLLAFHGADLLSRRTPSSDMTPLMYACWIKSFEGIKSILRITNARRINVKNRHGKCALDYLFEAAPERDFWFVLHGKLPETAGRGREFKTQIETMEIVAFCYHHARCFFSNENGSIFLMKSLDHAIKYRQATFGLTKLLVNDCKVAFDKPEASMNGMTPLMLAMKSKSLPTVKVLIEAGASMQAKDASGKSVFVYCCENWPSADFPQIFKEFKIIPDDCLDFLKICEHKRIHIFSAILGRSTLFWPLVKQYFSTHGWSLFFAMFFDWKFSVRSEIFQKYLQPLFMRNYNLIAEFFKHYLSTGWTSLSSIIEELYAARMFDLLAAIHASRNELYRVACLFFPMQEIKFITKHWRNQLTKSADIADEKDLFKVRSCIVAGALSYPIREEEKIDLSIKLKSECQSLFTTPRDSFKFYAQTGNADGVENLFVRDFVADDKEKFSAIKLAASGKHWLLATKIAQKLTNKLYVDEDGNTILHLIPLYKTSIQLFRSGRSQLLWALFGARNGTGRLPFDLQLCFHKSHGIGLILILIKFLPFNCFLAALEMMETLHPGYFLTTLVPKYGALLLCHARTFECCEFFVSVCKISIDSRVVSLYGEVYTPSAIALSRKKTCTKTLELLQVDSNLIDSTSFCKLMVGNHFIPSKKWFNRTFHDAETVFLVLKSFLQLDEHERALKFCSIALKSDKFKFSSGQLASLASQAHDCGSSALLELLLRKAAIDFNFQLNDAGYSVIDAFLGKMELKSKHLNIIKTFDLQRVVRLLNPDGSLVLARTSSFPINNEIIMQAFPQLTQLLRFGIESLRSVSEVDPSQVFGCFETCAICKCDFEESEALTLLTCKHLFHNQCLYEATRNSFCCPYCRKNITN